MEKKAVIYARVSSTNDRQSTERQVIDLTRYASANGYAIAQVFEEHISGAKKNAERQGLTNALEYCITSKADMLLCSELSRLGRNAFETLETIKLLVDHKINLYLQKEQFTLLDAEGKPSIFAPIMLATLSTCAELERDSIKFRLNSGRAKAIAEGKKMGRPLGSKNKDQDIAEKLMAKYPKVVKELKHGTSVRRTAVFCDVCPATVQKIKRVLAV